ncbi:MAG: hrpA, partial [Frankiales bacterium]|nr:hrpA [Frankiales bacterium]
AFYDARIPADVVSGAHFDAWWKPLRDASLDLTLEDLVRGDVDPGEHPDVWVSEDLRLPLSYAFEPGSEADGVTVDVPVEVLNRVRPEDFAWQVPGLRLELVTALIKTLPKPLRVRLVPAPDTARQLLERLAPRGEHLLHALSREARALRGVDVPPDAWDLTRIPAHLRPTFRVVGPSGEVVGEGKDLAVLQSSLAGAAQEAISSAAGDLEVAGLTSWTIDEVPLEVSSGSVVGYPALVDEGASVALRVLPAPSPDVHHAGVRRLVLLNVPSPVKAVSGLLNNRSKLTLATYGKLTELMDDAIAASVDALLPAEVRTREAFEAALPLVRAELPEKLLVVLRAVEEVLGLAAEVDAALTGAVPAVTAEDVRAQRAALVQPGFITAIGAARLTDVVRYLKAVLIRLEKAPRDATRDVSLMAGVHEVTAEWARLPSGPAKEAIRWQIEELRVSLFAQTIKARGPVSIQRVYKAIDAAV